MYHILNLLPSFTTKDPYKIDPKQIENVCFKGGGMKGNAFVGVDKALTELGLWNQIKRFIGSSAGAIFAAAAACRIPYSKMKEIIDKTDYSKFKDTPWGIIGEGARIYEYLGLYDGAYFYNWYGSLLAECVGNSDITFQEVYTQFKSELVITTTDLTIKKLVYISRETDPDLPIRDAIRRSMSIPTFYIPIVVRDDKGIDHVYVDGGCSNNFPIDYFDKIYSTPEEAFSKTIGFNLQEDTGVCKINNIIDLMNALVNTEIEEIQRIRLKPKDPLRIIDIPTFDLSSTDFSMSKENIERLEKSGYDSTMHFFNTLTNNI